MSDIIMMSSEEPDVDESVEENGLSEEEIAQEEPILEEEDIPVES